MEICADEITGFLSFLFYHHDRDFAEVLDKANKSSDPKSSVLSVEGKRDLSVGRAKGRESRHLGSFSIEEENGIGSQLRDHMVTPCSTELSQRFPPIPAICQKIDFTGDRETKRLKYLFDQKDFGSKGAASFGSFRVIEFGPEGQKEVLIEESKEDPLVAKDMGFACSLFMPSTSGHLLACLLGNGVIHDKKEDRMGVDSQMMEELGQSGLGDLFHGPDILSEESGEAGKRPTKKGACEGLDHRGCMGFFARLNEADDKGRENLKRRS
jgi:hypothetical protein